MAVRKCMMKLLACEARCPIAILTRLPHRNSRMPIRIARRRVKLGHMPRANAP